MRRFLIILLSAFVCFISCKDLKQAQSDIAELQGRVDSIEAQMQSLQKALDEGKIIKEITRYSDNVHSGWAITFTNNESVIIYDGITGYDGVTPQLRINSQGYWEVSYDNGASFTLVTDSKGNNIMSKGEGGLSLRFVVAEDGSYVIETYSNSDPGKAVESISTEYSADASSCIASIVTDPYKGIVTMTMSDGSEYAFNLDVNRPTSVVVLAESIVLPKNGEVPFKFRVNPSNAVVDLDLNQETPMFELDLVIENMTRSYTNAPENYSLEKVEADVDAEGNVKQGQYIAYVKENSVSDVFCQGISLVVNTKDANGENVQISSDILKVKSTELPELLSFSINDQYPESLESEFVEIKLPYGTDRTALKPEFEFYGETVKVDGKEVKSGDAVDFSAPVEFEVYSYDGKVRKYIVAIYHSDLPVVYVNTKDSAPIVSKEDWLKGTDIYIINAGEDSKLYSSAQIRGRGNTTWGYPKKPYAIKLDKKDEVLGMPKHKRWVLLANYVDKTCIRNSVAFEIARRSEGLDWTPRGQHVDVVLNGVFLGNYFLCEQIKVDKNRVDIAEMESTDIDAESITGGYLLEIDKNYDEINKFMSPVRNMPFMIKEPDEEVLTAEQFSWIQNHVAEIENALYGEGTSTEGYLQYIDLDSYIDYWIVYELTSAGEPTHPKSVYMYKDRGGKMHAGPVWDFDYFTFQPYYKNMLINMNAVWNDRIINDPATHPVIKQRWNAARDKYRTISEEMMRQYESIKESAEYNATLWPLNLNVNRDDAMSVSDAVERMKGYYDAKFEYMDTYINTNF